MEKQSLESGVQSAPSEARCCFCIKKESGASGGPGGGQRSRNNILSDQPRQHRAAAPADRRCCEAPLQGLALPSGEKGLILE